MRKETTMDKQGKVKLTRQQQDYVNGNGRNSFEYIKNENGSIFLEKGISSYEEFKELLNHLFTSDKIKLVHGKYEDFVLIKDNSTINVT